jgi:BirA family transcriptional regulator, biotin operon repressor / biotin---[acetyl-CoA-carboxylase] ligase
MNETDIRQALSGIPLADIRYFASTSSTNEEAFRWAESGAADFALVIADEQTAGRGRMGRKWITNPGSGLAFTLVLHPTDLETASLSLFPLLSALVVSLALSDSFSLSPKIKWPNDVLINNSKVSGILCEAIWQGETIGALIVGIGINVLKSAVPPPEEVIFPATSLEQGLNKTVDRLDVLASILKKWIEWRPQIGKQVFFDQYLALLAFRNQTVQIERVSSSPLIGIVQGITNEGDLCLKTDLGVEYIKAGDVHLRPNGLL